MTELIEQIAETLEFLKAGIIQKQRAFLIAYERVMSAQIGRIKNPDELNMIYAALDYLYELSPEYNREFKGKIAIAKLKVLREDTVTDEPKKVDQRLRRARKELDEEFGDIVKKEYKKRNKEFLNKLNCKPKG